MGEERRGVGRMKPLDWLASVLFLAAIASAIAAPATGNIRLMAVSGVCVVACIGCLLRQASIEEG